MHEGTQGNAPLGPSERPHRDHGGHDACQHVLYQDFVFLSSNMLACLYYAASIPILCRSGKVLSVLELHAESLLLILLLPVVVALSFPTTKYNY